MEATYHEDSDASGSQGVDDTGNLRARRINDADQADERQSRLGLVEHFIF